MNKEQLRLLDPRWRKWGPYLSERQWGTVREDYSEHGNVWGYFPHDHARSRTYRWGEDGIAGISDDKQRICFGLAMWNGKDPILKERLFGLTGSEGNHGEDVKELYYYLDNVPSHAYMKHLYKYPQKEYPYTALVSENQQRSREEGEYEIIDTGLFEGGQYFDVVTEYAKADPEDLCIRVTVHNRSEKAAYMALLPMLWLRNLWDFGLMKQRPAIQLRPGGRSFGRVEVEHEETGPYQLYFEQPVRALYTENETNRERIFGIPNASPFVKDAFHHAVIHRDFGWLEDRAAGTKFSPMYEWTISGGASVVVRLRLCKDVIAGDPFDLRFDNVFTDRIEEADRFYADLADVADDQLVSLQRQAFAGMLWNKQYYNIDIPRWLNGDPGQPIPHVSRRQGRNHQWQTLNNEDIISMPDKWEYPWYAAWDLAFHCIPLAMLDPVFAKEQLILFLREWYMHPNGQLPAYEWSFGDVNPPVHAWSCLQVYKLDKARTGKGDVDFLERVFQKLLINFTWWVNRKDHMGNNVFEGGFLGLDNIGVFDRSSAIPGNGTLEQADGTSWMAMYCLNLLEMALEISQYNCNYEDVTTKFFEHFVYIAESLNRMGGNRTASWDDSDEFFYDVLCLPDGRHIPLKVRSLVGMTTLFAVLVLKKEMLAKVPDFHRRLKWFQQYRQDNGQYLVIEELKENDDILLSLIPRHKLEKILRSLLDEREFLSIGGVRSISKLHTVPYIVYIDGQAFGLKYQPAEADTALFGGNSNWRGPVWMPMNYLIICALQQYGEYYGDGLQVELPSGSGQRCTLSEVSLDLSRRLISIFLKDAAGRRPVHGDAELYRTDPYFRDLVLFYEYFHGDNGRGVGASHQTGWTGVVAELINRVGRANACKEWPAATTNEIKPPISNAK